MQTIHKYPLHLHQLDQRGAIKVKMPQNAIVLSVQFQNDQLCAWAMGDTAFEMEEREFFIIGTGHDASHLPVMTHYVATVQRDGLVLHVFQLWK